MKKNLSLKIVDFILVLSCLEMATIHGNQADGKVIHL